MPMYQATYDSSFGCGYWGYTVFWLSSSSEYLLPPVSYHAWYFHLHGALFRTDCKSHKNVGRAGQSNHLLSRARFVGEMLSFSREQTKKIMKNRPCKAKGFARVLHWKHVLIVLIPIIGLRLFVPHASSEERAFLSVLTLPDPCLIRVYKCIVLHTLPTPTFT